MEFRFCIQDPTYVDTTYLYEAIIGAAVNAASWRGIFAFASRDGVDHLIKDPVIEKFMRDGGEVDLLVGIDAVTNRTTLDRLHEIEQSNEFFRPRVFWNETRSLFHPKISVFSYAGGKRTLIVGSGNLTPGGLMTNFENYTVISAELGEEIDVSALDEFLERHAHEIRTIDNEALERAAQNIFQPIKSTRKADGVVIRRPHHQRMVIPGHRPKSVARFDRILVAQVPKAGGRWAQVHFNAAVVQQYFRISDYGTQRVYLTQILEDGALKDIEVRPCVFSQTNKNHKIEIRAAKGQEYPETPPILVFREHQVRVFDYMLVFPREDGYDALVDLTQRLPTIGRGFPRVITNLSTLEGAWGDCPLLTSKHSKDQEI